MKETVPTTFYCEITFVNPKEIKYMKSYFQKEYFDTGLDTIDNHCNV